MSKQETIKPRSMHDLSKVYQLSEEITETRARLQLMIFNGEKQSAVINKNRTNRIENFRVRISTLTLMRQDELMRIYSNATLNRQLPPLKPLLHRKSRSSAPPLSSLKPRKLIPVPKPPTPSPRQQPFITPLKVTHIDNKPDLTVITMAPISFHRDEEDDEGDIIYPEGVTDFRPYKTVARFRKAHGQSTNFQLQPLLVGDDSAETLVLGLESFAEQHGCDLSFTNEDQQFDESIYRAACGIADLGSIHLLATDSLLTANFQFEIDLDYDNDITQSKENIEKFILDFCEAISKVLPCDNSNVRVFSINKLAKKSGRSNVNFGLTTPKPKRTEQLAQDLQTRARSDFGSNTILRHVKAGEYEYTWKAVLTHLQVRPSDLDPQHNFDYRAPGVVKEDIRGGHPYYLPIGWYRHALKVLDKYGDDHTWIGRINAKGEWPVAYHGTKKDAVSGIVAKGLLPSAVVTDVMMIEAIEQIGEEANQPGLYVATHCNEGSYPRYTTPFTVTTFPDKSEQFSIVFQCRVEPSKFTTHTSPVKVGKAWRIVNPNAIRPYGILLKKEDSSERKEETST